MTLALYRQASIAIAKRYITELMKRINFYEPSRATDPRNLLAIGARHHTRTLLTAYAIDSAYPTRLQPELVELYHRLSTLWQESNEQYYRDHCHLWVKSNLPTNNVQTPEPASSPRKGSPNPLKRGREIEEPPRYTSPQPTPYAGRVFWRDTRISTCWLVQALLTKAPPGQTPLGNKTPVSRGPLYFDLEADPLDLG
jgi:hypothetical protein